QTRHDVEENSRGAFFLLEPVPRWSIIRWAEHVALDVVMGSTIEQVGPAKCGGLVGLEKLIQFPPWALQRVIVRVEEINSPPRPEAVWNKPIRVNVGRAGTVAQSKIGE